VYKLAWGFYLLLGLGGVLWMGAQHETISLGLFLDPARWWVELPAGLVAGGLLLALWELAARRLALARELEERIESLLTGLEPSHAVALAVMSGFAEEVFFRGAVQSAWGFAPACALFALLHTGREACFRLWTVFALIAGLVFGGLVLWTGTLLAPIVAHMLVNGVNLYRLAAGSGMREAAADEAAEGGVDGPSE
jgi:membrane protease YdiL (CAAX protease family)